MSGKKIICAIMLVASLMLVAGCTGSGTGKTVAKNDTVTVEYTGWFDNGTIFDTSNETVARDAGIYDANATYEPIEFQVGSGDVIEGFDSAVVGLKVNETREITIAPEDAYGEYDPTLIQPVNMSVLLEAGIDPQVNDTLYYGLNPVTIHSIPNNTTVMIDFNHPLAGKTLHFSLKVLNITTAS